MTAPVKMLVLGSGGREHAVLATLARTSQTPLDLFCIPGNAGIGQLARCINIPLEKHDELLDFAQSEGILLTFVGPEAPLAAGIVDKFESRGMLIAGPNAAAARLEGSKVFAKDFMLRHNIPTARYAVVDNYSDAQKVIRSGEFGAKNSRIVLKADGLAAGKGVVITSSFSEAEAAANDLISGAVVGKEAASRVVIEESLAGAELSLLAFADGEDYRLMPVARDHKRIGENDTGPNTGGMGAVTDESLLPANMLARIEHDIVRPTLAGADAEGFPFRGILFVGLMLTAEGPKVLEYNVRFGDPETQAILVRLRGDLFEILKSIATGTLGGVEVRWSDDSSACVVLASKGYPGRYETGAVIKGLETCAQLSDVTVFHAGTTRSPGGEIITSGGRVLAVTATASTLETALASCYGAIGKIHWDGMQYRRDIGRGKQEGRRSGAWITLDSAPTSSG
jgi:phosphoribosylamine--glycine ligase